MLPIAAQIALTAATPWAVIPSVGNPFHMSDSYSLQMTGAPVQAHTPGVFHQWATWPASNTFFVYLTHAEFAATPLTTSDSGVNMDVEIGLYDVSSGCQWTGVYCKLTSPHVPTPRRALIMNHSARRDNSPPAIRNWGTDTPLRLQCDTPATGGPFQVGPVYTFHNGIGQHTLHYQHWWQGVIAGN